MNRQVVSIETLKSYFETGKKPTQAQFSNLIDAFYHKNESIPQDKIDGLADTLSNKAETTAVDAKANADASDLGDENVAKWKEALGVGEVPDNIAKIDTESEQGNVYDKTQVDDLLESSGKNVANSNLTSETGAGLTLGDIWGIRTNGFPFRIEDLPDVTGRATHQTKLMLGDDQTIGRSTKADINVYLPESMSVSGMGNHTITVNHIYPNKIPDREPILEGIQELMGEFKNLQFKPFVAEDFTINNLEDRDTSPTSTFTNGAVVLQNNTGNKTREIVYTNAVSRTFPHNKQWVIKLNIQYLSSHESKASVGLAQTSNPNSLSASLILGASLWNIWNEACAKLNTPDVRIYDNDMFLIIAHANNIIYASIANNKGEVRTQVMGNYDENGDYRILAKLDKVVSGGDQKILMGGEYWIEE